MKLKNIKFAGKSLITSYGELKFDEEGVLVSPEVPEAGLKALSGLKGFSLEEGAKKEDKKPAVAPEKVEKDEPKEEVAEEVKPAEDAPEDEEKTEEKPKRTSRSKKQ